MELHGRAAGRTGTQQPARTSIPARLPTAPRLPRRCRRAAKPNVSRAATLDYVAVGLSNNSSSGPDRPAFRPSTSPSPASSQQNASRDRPLVRVQLSVLYRVHSRQMLCIGGSQIPFGWSFLSIAKIPMTWNQGDVWTCEVDLVPGQHIEYKYVILEEQDWTKIENEDAEGVVEISYRSGSAPGTPPDVQTITKQMAIVAWQPGPNRVLQVPTEAELSQLRPGSVVQRLPQSQATRLQPPFEASSGKAPAWQPSADPYKDTWEELRMTEGSGYVLSRRDMWTWTPAQPQA